MEARRRLKQSAALRFEGRHRRGRRFGRHSGRVGGGGVIVGRRRGENGLGGHGVLGGGGRGDGGRGGVGVAERLQS